MKLYWLDIETTGLDPAAHTILEIAVREADLLKPFGTTPIFNSPIYAGHIVDGMLEPFIVDMHTKNGLLAECRHKSVTTMREAEEQLLRLIPMSWIKEERGVLAGSSVHFDHSFLRVHMPELSMRLSHRHYDVSAVSLFCRSLGMPYVKAEPAHRAMPDVLQSIEIAMECTRWLDATSHLYPNSEVCDGGGVL